MPHRPDILEYYSKTRSYAATGRRFNISRQRVHQLITGYTTISKKFCNNKYHRIKVSKYDKAFELKTKPCLCGELSIALHHIDGNPHNNHISNLLPICHKCHSKKHTGQKHNYPPTKQRRVQIGGLQNY